MLAVFHRGFAAAPDPVLAQLFQQGGAAQAQQRRRMGNHAAALLQGLADQFVLDFGDVLAQVQAARRQRYQW